MTQDESVEVLGVSMHIPDPVFFCSIEPPSQVYKLVFTFHLLIYNFFIIKH